MKADDAKALRMKLNDTDFTPTTEVLRELLELVEHQLRMNEETEYDMKAKTSNRIVDDVDPASRSFDVVK